MQKAITFIGVLRQPAVWMLITAVLAHFGLPPTVSATIGAVLDTAPSALDTAATLISATVAAAESVRAAVVTKKIKNGE